jgi:hypothetical protein
MHYNAIQFWCTLTVCMATSKPYNAVQFWYLKCLYGNFQGLQCCPIFGTLIVCMAASKAYVLPYTSQCCPVLVPLVSVWQLPSPTCCHTHHNAFQFWYLKCLYGNFQALHVAIHITMLSSFGTLNVCMATSKAWCFPL